MLANKQMMATRVAGQRFARPALVPRFSRKAVRVQAAKQSVGDLGRADLEGKRVLVRSDLNTPMQDGKVSDATRVRWVRTSLGPAACSGSC
jgi:hypothetical protein